MDKSWKDAPLIGEGGFAQVYANGPSLVVKKTDCEATQFLFEKCQSHACVRTLLPAIAQREESTAWSLEKLYANPLKAKADRQARALRSQFLHSKPHYEHEFFSPSEIPASFLRWAQGKSLQQLALYSPWQSWQQTFSLLRSWKPEFETKHPGLTYEADFRASNVMFDMFGQAVLSDPVAPWPVDCEDPYKPKELDCEVLLYWQFARPGMRPDSVLCALPLMGPSLQKLASGYCTLFPQCRVYSGKDPSLWKKLSRRGFKSWTQGITPAQERISKKVKELHFSLYRRA